MPLSPKMVASLCAVHSIPHHRRPCLTVQHYMTMLLYAHDVAGFMLVYWDTAASHSEILEVICPCYVQCMPGFDWLHNTHKIKSKIKNYTVQYTTYRHAPDPIRYIHVHVYYIHVCRLAFKAVWMYMYNSPTQCKKSSTNSNALVLNYTLASTCIRPQSSQLQYI